MLFILQSIEQVGPALLEVKEEPRKDSESAARIKIKNREDDSGNDDGSARQNPTANTEMPKKAQWRRRIHNIMQDKDLVSSLLRELYKSLDRLRGNWDSCIAIGVFASVATRMLSLGSEDPLEQQKIMDFLKQCQVVCSEWLEILRKKFEAEASTESRASFLRKARDVALMGMASFSVDQGLVPLVTGQESAKTNLLAFAIMIQETEFGIQEDDEVMRVFTWKAQRVMRLVHRSLVNLGIRQKKPTFLNDAIRRGWNSFQPAITHDWKQTKIDSSWVTTRCMTGEALNHGVVHFDLLTGELLVDGAPLSGLPQDYQQHQMYQLLFGRNRVQVFPSSEPDMKYVAKSPFQGHTVYFGSLESSHLPIRTRLGETTYDLLPPKTFEDVLPKMFVSDFFHWYNRANGSVEFRNKNEPWKFSSAGWTLFKAKDAHNLWKLCKEGNVYLVGHKNALAHRLQQIFNPVEEPDGLHLLWDNQRRVLDIDIPRLQLGFSINEGSDIIKSLQFRDMIVDICQGIESLVGLVSKLVLRHNTNENERIVLIPEGTIEWKEWEERTGELGRRSHTKVSIGYDAQKAYTYRMKPHLGRLSGSGDLQSKLLLAYLHALTSHPLPDPFTGHTGTEEALNILRSESVRSVATLSKSNIEILERIATLTPSRRAYPLDSRSAEARAKDPHVMQKVKWDSSLTFQAQHGGFVREVLQLFEDARKRSFLYPESPPVPELTIVDDELLERDSIRSSTFYVEGYGAELFSTDEDDPQGRGRGQDSERCQWAFEIAQTLNTGQSNALPQAFPTKVPGMKAFKEVFADCNYISSVKTQKQQGATWQIKYSFDWLKPMAQILPDQWWALHGIIPSDEQGSVAMPKRIAWLASIAFMSTGESKVIVLALLAIAAFPSFIKKNPPACSEGFHLKRGETVEEPAITSIVNKWRRKNFKDPENAPKRELSETLAAYDQRCSDDFEKNQNEHMVNFVKHIIGQKPDKPPELPDDMSEDLSEYFYVGTAMRDIKEEFKIWANNIAFKAYHERLCTNLKKMTLKELEFPSYTHQSVAYTDNDKSRFVSIKTMLAQSSVPILRSVVDNQDLPSLIRPGDLLMDRKLEAVIEELEIKGTSAHEKDYLRELKNSNEILKDRVINYEIKLEVGRLQQLLQSFREEAKSAFDTTYVQLKFALEDVEGGNDCLYGEDPGSLHMAMIAGHMPRISTRTMLQLLRRIGSPKLSDEWRKILITFATGLKRLQWADRLIHATYGDMSDLIRELKTPAPHASNSMGILEPNPEKLLLEIDSDVLVRQQQEEIAAVMQCPPDDGNSVLQLNMGEGKSSVIIPLVAMNLADNSSLVRVVVPKAQFRQMVDILEEKLGNLVGRRVYQLPFCRALEWGENELTYIENMLRKCAETGGVLLVQPEHILSLHHTIIDFHRGKQKNETESKQKAEENAVMEAQLQSRLGSIHERLQSTARDLLDESDDVFSPRRELVYSIGDQQSIEFNPTRWLIIQELLTLVDKFSGQVKAELPHAILVDREMHCFPRIRILEHEAWNKLKILIAEYVLENGLPGFPPVRGEDRDDIVKYISKKEINDTDVRKAQESKFWRTTSSHLHLLRGLLAGGILKFALGKRWRVDFGLDPSRRPSTMLIVPYLAKDCPAPRSEFSHPEVVITLTCLCYYYGGLDQDGMAFAINRLLMSDQAEAEYQAWVASAPNLPPKYRHLEGVNWDDADQRAEVIPHFQYSKGTVDFMLANVVFPKELREFPQKLSASGWTIGQQKQHPMTGFSGTNDARYVLPHTVKQIGVPSQEHTNAHHLETIIQCADGVCVLTKLGHYGVPKALDIIRTVVDLKLETRVILDVGAQVLEMTNEEVARTWLGYVKSKQVHAAVFVNESDQLAVIDRRGYKDLLKNSHYQTQLDSCLVFLDESHTRGTDLRLPSWYRAAVTLSTNLTKDRIMQGMLC